MLFREGPSAMNSLLGERYTIRWAEGDRCGRRVECQARHLSLAYQQWISSGMVSLVILLSTLMWEWTSIVLLRVKTMAHSVHILPLLSPVATQEERGEGVGYNGPVMTTARNYTQRTSNILTMPIIPTSLLKGFDSMASVYKCIG